MGGRTPPNWSRPRFHSLNRRNGLAPRAITPLKRLTTQGGLPKSQSYSNLHRDIVALNSHISFTICRLLSHPGPREDHSPGRGKGRARIHEDDPIAGRRKSLGQNGPDDVAMDVRQSALDAVVIVGQAFVIDSQQVQHGGVVIVHCRDSVTERRPNRRSPRSSRPPFTPAPIIQHVNASGL